ncbi:putative reverse transcriptase domain-containing protein [Tanacetum coccineum]
MRAASPPLLLPSTSHRTNILEDGMPPWKRACFTTLASRFEDGESSAAAAARQPGPTLEADLRRDRVREMGYGITDTWDEIVEAMQEIAPTTLDGDDRAFLRARVSTLFRDRPYHRHTTMLLDREETYARRAWAGSKDKSAAIEAHPDFTFRLKVTSSLGRISDTELRDPEPRDEPAEAGRSSIILYISLKYHQREEPPQHQPQTTLMTNAQIKALIARGVVDALAERDADRSRNGDDRHDSGGDGRRRMPVARECTYTDFLKCQPLNFKGTEGVFSLTQWLEKMESVFHISNFTVACQVKFATCTLQGNSLTWWNSHVRTVGHDVAYAMPWKTLKKKMTDKYYPKGEIKKLETKMWNLKMFPEESNEVEKYVSGLPNMIHESVKASKPKKIQEAIEFATELMD